MVIAIAECPKRSLTIFAWTPSASSNAAAVAGGRENERPGIWPLVEICSTITRSWPRDFRAQTTGSSRRRNQLLEIAGGIVLKSVLTASLFLAAVLPPTTGSLAAAAPPIPIAVARHVFARAHALCSADGGRLWGVSLCGPLMLADPQTHEAIANVPVLDAKRDGSYYRFTLAADAPIGNAPFEYDGIRFAQIKWPLKGGTDKQAVTLMHESFHRIQPKLGFVVKGAREEGWMISGDPALDTETGRIWLRGEIHALRRALTSSGIARKEALSDALELRSYRYAILPSTVAPEHVLDVMEGLAESTGIDVGVPHACRIAYTLRDMRIAEAASNYAREFFFAIGPAYAELLDAVEPNWRRMVVPKTSIASLAARGFGIKVVTPSASAAQAILARYGGAAIEREEAVRERRRVAREAEYRAELVTGPTLRLPMKDFRISFNAKYTQRLGRYGTVYHHVIVSAPWGRIKVSHGDAMIDGSFSSLTVAAPATLAGSTLHGNGWVLELSPGEKIVPDSKKPGSYTVASPPLPRD